VNTKQIVLDSIHHVHLALGKEISCELKYKKETPCPKKTLECLSAFLSRDEYQYLQIFQKIQDSTKRTSNRWQRQLSEFPEIPLPLDKDNEDDALRYRQDCAARCFVIRYAQLLFDLYRQTQGSNSQSVPVCFQTKMCSILKSICDGMNFCEAQDAHLDWRLIGEAVGHIALTNISSEESAIGIYLNSPPTIKFVRGFVDKYYDKFLAEYEVAPSIYDPSTFMKNNVGAAFESENEKRVIVWDYIVSQAMEKADLPMWKCVNLVLMPWELVIATADTVHFGSDIRTKESAAATIRVSHS